MNLFATTFESVIALLGLGFVGFWIIRKRILPEDILKMLIPLAVDIALPSFIFVNIIINFSPAKSPNWWQLPIWWLGFTGIAAVLTLGAMFISQKKTRREFGISLFFHNGIFFPLAIIAGMFGDESSYLVYLFLFTLFYPAFFFSTYQVFFKRNKKSGLQVRKILNTTLLATIAAVIIRLAGMQQHIPDFVITMLTLLGGMTIPIIMIILGGNIYVDFHKREKLLIPEIAKFVIIKNILFPLIFLGLLILLRPEYGIALIILVQSAVPPVTAVAIFTERAGGDRGVVSQFLVASFIVSLISIPAMMSLFDIVFPAP